MVWFFGLTVLLANHQGWFGLFLGCGLFVLSLFERPELPDDAPCRKCVHRKDDHHGNCQECLREKVRGVSGDKVPCSKFAR